MNQKFKKKIFWTCLILFILLSISFIIYSSGYRFDFQKIEFIKTGGLFLKIYPPLTDIYINGEKEKKELEFLKNGIFLKNIISGKHKLEISKQEYFNWEKNIIIEPNLMNSFSHIILLPLSPNKNISYNSEENEEIIDFIKIGENQIVLESIIKEKYNNWQTLKFIEFKKEPIEFFRKRIISDEEYNLLSNFNFDKRNKMAIFSFSDEKQNVFYIWDLEKPKEINDFAKTFERYFPLKIDKILFHPFKPNQFVILSNRKIAILDINEKDVLFLPLERVLDFSIGKDNVFFINNSGFAYSYNLNLKKNEFWGEIEDWDFNKIKIFVSPDSQYFNVLLNNSSLFLISQKGIKLVDDNVLDIKFSLDNRKFAYFKKGENNENSNLRIYFLKDINQDIRKKEDQVINFDFNDNSILKIFWFKDSFHLFIVFNNKEIKFLEIDDRDKPNIFEYQFDFKNIKFIDNSIFLINNNLIEEVNLMSNSNQRSK